MRRIVSGLLVGLTVLVIIFFVQSRNVAVTAEPLTDDWGAALGVEKGKREEQARLIEEQKGKIIDAARPLADEQKEIEKQEQPLLDEKKVIDDKIEKFSAAAQIYKARCKSHTFKLPDEQQAYDSCMREYQSRQTEGETLDKERSDNLDKLAPYLNRWMKLDNELARLKSKWEDLDSKLTAVKNEIQRLDSLINKYRECQEIANRCRGANCSQKDLEFWHLCESITFDGANPNLLLGDATLASVDPNLPPLGWKPEPFKMTPNK